MRKANLIEDVRQVNCGLYTVSSGKDLPVCGMVTVNSGEVIHYHGVILITESYAKMFIWDDPVAPA